MSTTAGEAEGTDPAEPPVGEAPLEERPLDGAPVGGTPSAAPAAAEAPIHCHRCGRIAPVEHVVFRRHTGMFVFMVHEKTDALLCRICVGQVFASTTLLTLLLGWWGFFSFFVTLFVLPANVFNYLGARRLAWPATDALPHADRVKIARDGYAARQRELSIGWPAPALALLSLVHWGLVIGAAQPILTLGWITGDSPPVWAPALVLGPSAILALSLASLVLRRLSNVASGTKGRTRLVVLATGTILRGLGFAGLAAVLGVALTDPNALALGLGLGDNVMPVGSVPALWESIGLVTAAQGTYGLLVASVAISIAGIFLELGGAVATWFLAPTRIRRITWVVLDVIIAIAFVAVTLTLPMQPMHEGGPILLPSIRLSITTLAAVRLLYWTIPLVLTVLERGLAVRFFGRVTARIPLIGTFPLLVAARLLRAKKSGFLTAIGALSILAVSFSSCTLTTTLSVMGGFRDDLKRKILGNNAHVLIDQEHGSFEGWDPTLQMVRNQPGVVAATPYVQGEVMITSATNLAGAVIRGIDPETIGDVTELRQNLRHGRMEYLSEPERLLRLRSSEMRRGLLAPDSFDEGMVLEPPIDSPLRENRGSLFDDAERALDAVERPDDPDSLRIGRDIDDFLLEDEVDRAVEADETGLAGTGLAGTGLAGTGLAGPRLPGPLADPEADEEVLPGLIVGQELARTLRLHVGDEVNVVSPLGGGIGPSGPMPKTRPFRIAGIFYSGMYEFDMKMAYTTLEAAQRFLSVGDAISGIEIKVDDTDHAEPIARAIADVIARPGLRVRSWQEVNRNLFGALQLEKLAMFITLGIAILVASFCIIGTLSLMVQEKGKEVGILKAMGATGEQIVAVFMAQGLMIGVLGAVTGLGLGYVTCFIAEHFGIVQLDPEVYYIDKLPVHIDPAEFVWTGIACVVVCLLATIYPAILGSRLRPVDALRYA